MNKLATATLQSTIVDACACAKNYDALSSLVESLEKHLVTEGFTPQKGTTGDYLAGVTSSLLDEEQLDNNIPNMSLSPEPNNVGADLMRIGRRRMGRIMLASMQASTYRSATAASWSGALKSQTIEFAV